MKSINNQQNKPIILNFICLIKLKSNFKKWYFEQKIVVLHYKQLNNI
jgi:hypothetical protein